MVDSDPLLRHCFTLILLLLTLPNFSNATAEDDYLDAITDHIMSVSEDDVRRRLAMLDDELVEPRYDPTVRAIIRRYVEQQPEMGGRIIGRTTVYFPIFESSLEAARLPEALKYLAITESALVVRAESRVGATGLWQFMPGTARELGLRIDEYVDERLDPKRSTEAALVYLRRLRDYFGDWALALAAYNAGPGNVRRAVRRAGRGGRDYWTVRKYLPKETQLYVPGFIAAAYLAEFYMHHQIRPELPELDRQLTETIAVFQPVSFYRLAQLTGLSIPQLQTLNPAYLQGYVPGYRRGHYLTLPRRVMPAVRTYLEHFAGADEEPVINFLPVFLPHRQVRQEFEESAYTRQVMPARAGEKLADIASRINQPLYQLAVWNNLPPEDSLLEDRDLIYFKPRQYVSLSRQDHPTEMERLPTPWPSACEAPERPLPACDVNVRVRLPRRQRLADFLEKWPGVDAATVACLNDLPLEKPLPAGTVVYLR